MVQLCPSATTPKTPKMAKLKTPKKSNALETPAKPEVKTPKQTKNTPVRAAIQTLKMKKEALVKEEQSTPKVAAILTPKLKKKAPVKETKSTPKAAAQTPKNGTASAKKNKTKTPKQEMPTEDIEMESEGEEEAPAAPSLKESVESEDAEMSSEEEEITVKSNSGKSSAPKNEKESKMVGEKFALFVRGLNYNSSEMAVCKHFSQFGTLIRCAIPRNSLQKNLNKGFGFVEFASQAAVDKALATVHALDSRILDVRVNEHEAAGKRKSEDQPGGDMKRQLATFDNELFVARLSFGSSKETVKEHFSQFGEVVNVGMPIKPNTSENKGFAFVAFKKASAVKKAMAATNQEIDSAKIVIKPSKKAVVKEPSPKRTHPNELFVGGLDNSTQRHTLEKHFSKYGKVSNVALPWNKIINVNKGFGFVSFKSAESLESALEKDHEIDGKKIRVSSAGTKSAEDAVSKKVKVEEEDDENDEEDDENDEEEDESDEGEEIECEDEEADGEDEEDTDEDDEDDE